MEASDIQKFIDSTGKSARQFAISVGIAEQQMNKYLTGKNSPSLKILNKIKSVYPDFMASSMDTSSHKKDPIELFQQLLNENQKVLSQKDEIIGHCMKQLDHYEKQMESMLEQLKISVQMKQTELKPVDAGTH